MTQLKGKVAIITGGGKGIGRAIAERFVNEGAFTAVLSRTQDDLDDLQFKFQFKASLFCESGDVSNEATVKRFVKAVQKKFKKIDILINSAGVLAPKSKVTHVKTKDWDQSLHVNLRGPFLMIKYVLPIMLQEETGLIINVNSGVAAQAAPEWGPYAVTKAGLRSLTLLTAEEINNTGVRIVDANPGGTRTRMRAKAYPDEDPRTLPTPEDVADLFVWLGSSTEASHLNGDWVEYAEWRKRHA